MNEERFRGKAAVYAKYRPAYPKALMDYLYSEVGLTQNSAIADIGSGTGKLTALLLRRGSLVYGVEPNQEMRSIAEQTLREEKRFRSIDASAEHTGLPRQSVDFITAAQAFHWFDRTAFLAECQRLLRARGKVILIWNNRESSHPLVMENDALNRRFCQDFRGFSGGMKEESAAQFSDFFRNGACDCREFRYDLVFQEESFIGRNLSASYAPGKSDENYQMYLSELKQLFAKYSRQGTLLMPNITRCFVGIV